MPLNSDSIGRVLGKRYRLLSALGTGASAHVFLAEDVTLQRHVAIKVLQPGLASDEAFLKRFGAEARSVASLNHPHVLRVFDWGEDSDGPYLVLEYLGGGSLRDLLDRGVRLTHSQAAHLGTEVAQGLAYAHSRGLVHRDIKPANLLFDEEGRVRVADFGVARALAEAAWTEPAGAMVGTARYASPESAEGRPVDGRADVYSLSLVLYEAVTGTVPFVADTTLGTLMARVGTPLPPHEGLGPLDDVLARAAAPDVAARLDAAGLAARLGALASALPTAAPLPLEPPHHATPNGALDGAPLLAPTIGFRAPNTTELTQVAAVPATVPVKAPVGTRAGPGELFDAEPLSDGMRRPKGARGGGPPLAGRGGGRRKLWWIIGVVVLVLALVAGALLAFRGQVFTPSHPMPALVNATLTKARADVNRVHFTLNVRPGVKSITVPAGAVVSQSPKPGTSLKEGSTVSVVPSLGKPSVAIPSLTGMTCAAAIAALQAVHLQGVCAPGAYSSTIMSGELILWSFGNTQDPTSAPYGSKIALVPSQGRAPIPVPDIPQSYTYDQAAAALQAVGLGAARNPVTSTSVPSGQVVSTSPASGAPAPYGSTVTVNVSTGPPTIGVPNIIGLTIADATTTLETAKLSVEGVVGDPSKKVTGSVPPTNTQVQPGSSVTICTNVAASKCK